MNWNTEIIEELGYPIIDAHAHPLLFFDTPKTGPADRDDFAAELAKRGIGMFCGTPIIRNDGTDPEIVEKLNFEALEWRKSFGEHYYPGVSIHPNWPESSVAALEVFHAQGFRWVGELVWYSSGYSSYATPEMEKILEVARDLGMILNIHPSKVEDMDKLASDFPTLTIVIAHPGGVADSCRAAYDLAEKHPNICFDLSGSGLIRWHMLRWGIDRLGVERFLFGTDYPVNNPGMCVYGALCEPLTKQEFKAVFRDNFLRMVGMA